MKTHQITLTPLLSTYIYIYYHDLQYFIYQYVHMFPISFPEYHRTQEAKEISPSHPAINLDGTGRAACGKAAHKPGIVFVQNHGEFLNDAEVVSCFGTGALTWQKMVVLAQTPRFY